MYAQAKLAPILLTGGVRNMKQQPGARRWGLAMVCLALLAFGSNSFAQKGDSGMFGWFGSKKSAQGASTVAKETGSSLQRQTALPAKLPAATASSFPPCTVAHLRGNLPDAQWVAEEVTGETRRVFRIPAGAGTPPLAILASLDAKKQVQVWELSNDKVPRFVKQRSVNLDPEQASWSMAYPVAATCLPGQQVALAVGFHNPRKRDALYIYHGVNNQFRRLDLIEPERSNGPPFTPFETLAASPDAMLLLYHTGAIRISADNFAYELDHVVLFSPKHPQGLEVLRLATDDGNVQAWAMQGTTLWLQTRDKRKKAQDFIWSLDLNKVL